jgi:hypothetical protein
MRKPDPVPTQLKRTSFAGSEDDDIPTERRRKSCPRLPVDDDEESDGAQAPLAGSRVRTTGPANIVTGTRQRSVVVSASRRSLIEDDDGWRHRMFV